MIDENQLPSGTPTSSPMGGTFSTFCTFAPFIIKALMNKTTRAFILNKIEVFNQKYIQGSTPNSKALNKIRKQTVKNHELKSIKQAVFNKLPIKNGRRCCPAGYDYSAINPGTIACIITDKQQNISSGNIRRTFTGHNKSWPDGTLFNDGCILGANTHTGNKSVLNGCEVMPGSVIGIGTVTKDSTHGNNVTLSTNAVAMGACVFGTHCKFGSNVTLKSDEHGNSRHSIGEHLTTGDNLSITNGAIIGHNADIGLQARLDSVTIHHSSKIRELSVLNSPYFAEPASEKDMEIAEPSMVSSSRITGSKSNNGVIAHHVEFVGCELSDQITSSVSCNYLQSKLALESISSNSVLDKCKLSNEITTFINPGVIATKCELENIVTKGTKESPVKLENSFCDEAEFSHTIITGTDTNLLSVGFNEGCEVVGNVNIGPYCDVNEDLKIRNGSFTGQIEFKTAKDAKLTFYKSTFVGQAADDSSKNIFVVHTTDDASHEVVFNSCKFEDVDNLVIKNEHARFNRTANPARTEPTTEQVQIPTSPAEQEGPSPSDYAIQHENNVDAFEHYNQMAEDFQPSSTTAETMGYDQPTILPNADIVKGLDHEEDEKNDLNPSTGMGGM